MESDLSIKIFRASRMPKYGIDFAFVFLLGFLMPIDSALASPFVDEVRQIFDRALNGKNISSDTNASIKKSLITARQDLEPALAQYDAALRKCQEDKDSAETACLESNNKGMNGFLDAMGSMADMGAMSMSATCNKMAGLMTMGSAAQAGFRVNCGMQKSTCEESCKVAASLHEKILGRLGSVRSQLSYVDDESNNFMKINNKKEALGEKAINELKTNCPAGKFDSMSLAELKSTYGIGTNLDVKDMQSCITAVTDITHMIEGVRADSEYKTGLISNLGEEIASAQANLNKAGDSNSPIALYQMCKDKGQVLAKVQANMMTLMNNIKQNTTCAAQLTSTGLNLNDCTLTGKCDTTTSTTDCTAPENKNAPYCRTNFAGTGIDPKPVDPSSMVVPTLDKSQLSKFSLDGTGGLGDGGEGDPSAFAGSSGGGSKTSTGGVPGGQGANLALPSGGGYNPGRNNNGRFPSATEDSNTGPGYSSGSSLASPFGSNKNLDSGDKYGFGADKAPQVDLKVTEGITSPQGLTLFEKVTKSYKNNRSLLMPE